MNQPLKIAFIYETFTYGGSETETINLILKANPELLQFTGIAVEKELPLPPHEPPQEFPKLYMAKSPHKKQNNNNDPRIIITSNFQEAVDSVLKDADIVICWGVPNVQQYIHKKLPIIILSKSSGTWTERFCHPNSKITKYWVGNSTASSTAFPEPHKVKIIHDGIDPNRVKITRCKELVKNDWGVGPRGKVVGYLGRIAKDKGVEKIIKAMQLLPDWHLVMVGASPNSINNGYCETIRRLCEELIPNRYKLLPWTKEVGNSLIGFDVLCHPSEYEGFSNSLAEAWLLGVPTIYTEETGAITDLGEMGIPVSMNPTPEELAGAIKKSLSLDTEYPQKRIQNNFLIHHNIERWTNYLYEVHKDYNKPKILVLYPNLTIGGATTWLFNLMKNTQDEFNWCGFILNQSVEIYHEKCLEELEKQCPYFFAKNDPAKISEIINMTKPDLILVWGQKKLSEMLPHDLKIPTILISHGADEGEDIGSKWARLVCQNASQATGLVAVSKAAVSAFPVDQRHRVEVINNGVEIPNGNRLKWRASLGLFPGDIAIGYVGRLNLDKNPFDIAKAVSVLPNNYKGVFIGPECIFGLRRDLNSITNKNIFRDGVSPEEALEVYQALDVIINSSKSEGFGLMVVEAWLNRVPVISTRVGIIKELSHLIVPLPFEATHDDLKHAVNTALSEEFKPTIEEAYQYSLQNFTARGMGEKWKKYIKTLLSSQIK